jgi:hypothetical protein
MSSGESAGLALLLRLTEEVRVPWAADPVAHVQETALAFEERLAIDLRQRIA